MKMQKKVVELPLGTDELEIASWAINEVLFKSLQIPRSEWSPSSRFLVTVKVQKIDMLRTE